MNKWLTEKCNGFQKLDKLERVKLVNEMRVDGLTVIQIHDELKSLGIVNKETDKPYALITIKKDCAELSKDFKKSTLKKMEAVRNIKYQQLDKIRKKAMIKDNYRAAISAIESQCKLYGLFQTDNLNVNIQNNVSSQPICNIVIDDFIEAEPINNGEQ